MSTVFEVQPRPTYVATENGLTCPHCDKPAPYGTLMKTIHFECVPEPRLVPKAPPSRTNGPGKCIACNETLQPDTPWTAVHWDCGTEIALGDLL